MLDAMVEKMPHMMDQSEQEQSNGHPFYEPPTLRLVDCKLGSLWISDQLTKIEE